MQNKSSQLPVCLSNTYQPISCVNQLMIDEREVNFGALCEADAKSLAVTCRCLKQDGFVFLDMTSGDCHNDLMKVAVPVLEMAAAYLQGSSRGKGTRTRLHGHISSQYKDSFNILSGDQYDRAGVPVDVEPLVKAMDQAARLVTDVLAQPLFGLETLEEIGEVYDLPLLDPHYDQSYGLLDIVCYHNDSRKTPNIVVSAHQDPGLFVLALPQTAPGLEFLDYSGRWVSPPPSKGVLWTGRAASDCLMPCIHRVRRHSAPRIACWHEICTGGQISAPLLQRLDKTQEQLALGSEIVGTTAVLEYLRRAEDHEGDDESPMFGFSAGIFRDLWQKIQQSLIFGLLTNVLRKMWSMSNPGWLEWMRDVVQPVGIAVADTVELGGRGVPLSKSAGRIVPLPIPPLTTKRVKLLRALPVHTESIPQGVPLMKVETATVAFPLCTNQDPE